MTKRTLPHDAIVLVADGRKALFLRNEGDEKFPNLVTLRVLSDENPPTHEQGSDKPGRAFQGVGTASRSSVETTDWHDLAEHRFAGKVAATLEELVRSGTAHAIVIAAAPRTLADLRHALHADAKARILAEIGKDLTKLPLAEIEKHLFL